MITNPLAVASCRAVFAAVLVVTLIAAVWAQSPRPVKIANPASENCIARGGQVVIERNPRGGQFGVCAFPDNLQCEEWAMLRGECRVGGIRVTGYATSAARYCAITGGKYSVTAASNTPQEAGTCTFASGASCDAAAYFEGSCSKR